MRRVRLEYHADKGSWWADSPDAPGFTAVGETLDELRQLAREGIRFFLGEEVLVTDDTSVRTAGPVVAVVNTTSSEVIVGLNTVERAVKIHTAEPLQPA